MKLTYMKVDLISTVILLSFIPVHIYI